MSGAEVKLALFDAIAATGKALANGKRLELLDLLAQGERSVESLARAAGLGMTTASAHLQALKYAGLVATRRQGTRIHYRLAGDDVARLYKQLVLVAQAHQPIAEQARIAYLGPDDTDQLSREELLERVRTGTVTVIDVRPVEEYNHGHIPHAVSIPLDQLESRLAELPADAEIVAYCRGANCVLAHDAVRLLRTRRRRATRLAEGMLEWRLADLPVAAGSGEIIERPDPTRPPATGSRGWLQQQSSPLQDSMPSRTDQAAMPSAITGSIHQPPEQAAVTPRPISTAPA